MAPFKHGCSFRHRGDIERKGCPPDAIPLQRRGRRPAQNPITVAAISGGEARVEGIRHDDRITNHDRRRSKMEVDRVANGRRSEQPSEVYMRHLSCRVNPRIRPACALHRFPFATEAEHSLLDRLLYRWTILLPLPSDERSPVILDNQTPAGHEASRSGWSRRRRFLPARGW